MGRHRRPSKTSSLAAGAPAAVAVGAMFVAPAAHAQAAAPARPAPATSTVTPDAVYKPTIHQSVQRAAAFTTVVVHSGNTLSGISASSCGTASDWGNIYAENSKVIGGNPNLIYPDQKLVFDCRKGGVVNTADPHPAVVRVSHPGRVWDVTYGYPNKCGDGDGDGWDIGCSSLAPVYAPHHHHSFQAAASFNAGTYSFTGLENLWVSAGGPAWAESAAASVAECESGGRADAFNPSGATGLWQILGAVVGGNLDNPYTNALNAVSKFKASGDSWAQWVCKP